MRIAKLAMEKSDMNSSRRPTSGSKIMRIAA
jgi:hypothetical protein